MGQTIDKRWVYIYTNIQCVINACALNFAYELDYFLYYNDLIYNLFKNRSITDCFLV